MNQETVTMITARPQKKLEHARQYFREHLAQGDYHSEAQTVAGEWFGHGVARLGLDPGQAVTQEAFVRLCHNRHPLNGDRLTVRQRAERRVFYDFVVSAPKSVSVLALTVGDDRIIAAHDAACRVAMARMEQVAAARVRQGGQRTERTTGEMVAAAFRHDTSRALDPQVHTHFVVFNATWDQVEARWKALEPSAMFEQMTFFTEVYRNELALALKGLGYQLRDAKHGFEISGVSDDILARFSQRSYAIAKAEAALAPRLKGKLSNDGRAALAHAVRPKKVRGTPSQEVLAEQRSRLSAEEWTALRQLVPVHQVPPTLPTAKPTARVVVPGPEAEAALDFARDHLFERRSVVKRPELLRVALIKGRGLVTLAELEAALSRRNEFIEVEGALTTVSALNEERRMIALINQGSGQAAPLAPGFMGNKELSEEQRRALHTLLSSSDQVVALRGGAGTGKTTLLRDVLRGIGERQAVAVFAPTGVAVEVLKKNGFTGARSVQWLLEADGARESVRGQVLLVDEAGMLSNRQMLALLELARAGRCRVILSGDTRQHGSVEAGDALRVLETQSPLQTAELKSVRRQVDGAYREAIADLAAGRGAQGLHRLERLGAVVEADDERYFQMASEYVASVTAGKSALIVTPTWREAAQATEEVRGQLQAVGRLSSDETTVTVHHPLKWTLAEKRDGEKFKTGHVLLFHGPTKEFACGDWGEVVHVERDRLRVRRADRQVVTVTKKQARCFDVAESRTIPVAAGDQLQLRGSRKRDKLLNGQIVTVKAVNADGRIDLEDGRKIPPQFKAFAHGYAVTSYTAQAKAVDHIYVAMDSHSLQSAHAKQFYVSASRGRERVRIFTDDRLFLREAVEQPGTRQAATELLNAQRAREAVTIQPQPRRGVKITT